VLHRTFKPAWFTRVAWIHHFNHDRWDLPYMQASVRPARGLQSSPALDQVPGGVGDNPK
jgi:hypothetical protein